MRRSGSGREGHVRGGMEVERRKGRRRRGKGTGGEGQIRRGKGVQEKGRREGKGREGKIPPFQNVCARA